MPFEVGPLDVRGRVIQLGPLLDGILGRHDYPEPVARLLAEACVVAVLLGSSLKFEGKFILQTRTDGPVDMLVADFTTPGSLRAYARFDADRLEALAARRRDRAADAARAGRAGAHHRPGRVHAALSGHRRARRHDACRRPRTPISASRSRSRPRSGCRSPSWCAPGEGEHWRAGGLIAQFLPEAPERLRMPDLPGGDGAPEAEEQVDNAWREVQALTGTIEPGELIDPTIEPERLLYRLFHEHGVRVFPGVQVADECSCSRERIRGILDGFSAEEIVESTEDGRIAVNCEFCSKDYEFDPAEFVAAN